MTRKYGQILIALIALLSYSNIGWSKQSNWHVSTDKVYLNSDFHGEQISLLGNVDKRYEVIVTVEGPYKPYRVRQKESVNGMWLSSRSFYIANDASYFFIASTNDLPQITTPQRLNTLGIHYPQYPYVVSAKCKKECIARFRENFQKYKESIKLYPTDIAKIERVGLDMLRTSFLIPERAITGTYKIKVYIFDQYFLKEQVTIPLNVLKIGMYNKIDEMAEKRPLAYALWAVGIALSISLLAALAFRNHV
ncbi:hypothetical protein EDM53_04025 [Rickettsiales endosymbiont of Peranema trichophorum]|uniref:TIGR02186 family protein n=1 Tax=Rickettsiales endosymbiont of Peranema trichophorum TaxID=2486577 RepID=UPI001023D79F|nr:TIGR02186 family protein [Rickettsiales endosymbiont of Peranema trichophorum]RZI46302.1 hypothetical protein EDM53_04025 [Rickettsiales endosymbiont of Peranema trichophorum]